MLEEEEEEAFACRGRAGIDVGPDEVAEPVGEERFGSFWEEAAASGAFGPKGCGGEEATDRFGEEPPCPFEGEAVVKPGSATSLGLRGVTLWPAGEEPSVSMREDVPGSVRRTMALLGSFGASIAGAPSRRTIGFGGTSPRMFAVNSLNDGVDLLAGPVLSEPRCEGGVDGVEMCVAAGLLGWPVERTGAIVAFAEG